MHLTATHTQRVLQLAHKHGWLRASDLAHAGIPRVVLTRMTASGHLVRAARGLYRLPNASSSEHEGLATVARKVPQAVICLLSALQFHGLTTQLPNAVWMTIPHKARTPNVRVPKLEIVRATGEVLTAGIERIRVEGVDVPIFSVAKTVADCFKHRRQIGEDVAIEALRDALRQRKTTASELMKYAAIDRVTGRIAPYIKAMQ